MTLVSDVVRSVVSSTMNILFLLSLLTPKYSKKTTYTVMFFVVVFNFLSSIYFYLYSNMTLIFKFGIILFIIYSIVLRPLFKDSFMQWFFTFITVINVIFTNIVLSYSISRYLPYPRYANTLVRFLMFVLLIYLVKKYVHPLYQQLLKYWNLFLFVAITIFLGFSYYFFASKDIIETLNTQAVPIHLLVLITYAVYTSLFFFIKTVNHEHELARENLKIKTNQDILHLSTSTMEKQIALLNEVDKQNSIVSHDRRHFNNTLLKLLDEDKLDEAINLLDTQASITSKKNIVYCENIIVNAAISHYNEYAQSKAIETKFDLDIPNDLNVDSIELSMVISNLFENAINACLLLEGNRKISITTKYVGSLIIEISNPYVNDLEFDENGYPISQNKNHGVGTKSVLAFVEKNAGDIIYCSKDNIFTVRLLV